jgi:hypothetical protein
MRGEPEHSSGAARVGFSRGVREFVTKRFVKLAFFDRLI